MRKGTAVLLVGGAIAAATLAGRRYSPRPQHPESLAWYDSIEKPVFTPPPAAIGAVWGVLEVLLGITGYRLLTAPPSKERTRALVPWSLIVAGLGTHSWLFFGRKRLDQSMVLVGGLLASSIASILTAARVDKLAAKAGVPLLAWVSCASLLAEETWRLNRKTGLGGSGAPAVAAHRPPALTSAEETVRAARRALARA